MRRFFSSIRFRVWILFIGFTTAILLFLFFNQIVALPFFYNYIKTQESIQTINYLKNSWNKKDLPNIIVRLAKEQEMMIQVWVFNPITGTPVVYEQDPNESYFSVSIWRNLTDEFKNKLLNSNGIIMENYETESRSVLFSATYVGHKENIQGYILINNYIEPISNTRNILERQFYLSATLILFFAFIISAFVVIKISNPIIKISSHANKLTTGEFKFNVKPNDYAEIRYLANNLNKASSEIAKTENLRRDLIANVSHDLKTPLTMIKAYAEMIRDLSGDNPCKREQHLKIIIDEADHLNILVTDMLDLSKLQSGVANINAEQYNLSENLENLVHRFDYFTVDGNYTIKTEIEENIIVRADMTKLEQAIYNLINNAFNHTGNEGIVTIRLIISKNGVCRFEVSDTGDGIAKEDIPLIWERYYKGEKSENHKRTTIGTGLGLSIVKGVLESHGFSYGVDSTVKKGSTFWFEIPIKK